MRRTFNCANCNAPTVIKNSSPAIFCSTRCCGENKAKINYLKWLDGDTTAITGPHTLRKAVIQRDGEQCSSCDLTEWQGQPVPLEMEHIDGDSTNDTPENLCMLCPNCHALTPTFKGRNRGHGRHARRQRYADGKSY